MRGCALDCGACARCDVADFDRHGDEETRCECEACRRVRARADREVAFVPVHGGISRWALDALGGREWFAEEE